MASGPLETIGLKVLIREYKTASVNVSVKEYVKEDRESIYEYSVYDSSATLIMRSRTSASTIDKRRS